MNEWSRWLGVGKLTSWSFFLCIKLTFGVDERELIRKEKLIKKKKKKQTQNQRHAEAITNPKLYYITYKNRIKSF